MYLEICVGCLKVKRKNFISFKDSYSFTQTYIHHQMFEGGRLYVSLSLFVEDPEGQSNHLLVVFAVHLSPHHVTELRELNIARVVGIELETTTCQASLDFI